MGLLDFDDDNENSEFKKWLKEQDEAMERERELASRPNLEFRRLNSEFANTSGVEKKASWLVSKHYQGIHLLSEEETNKYIIYLHPDSESEAVLLDVESIEEAMKIMEKLILNVQIAKTFGKKIEATDGEKVKMHSMGFTGEILARRVNDESQVLLDGNPLETTRNAADILLEHANIGQNGEKVMDFHSAGYMDATHVCLMRRMYDGKILLTDEQEASVTHYKNSGFMVVNALLRGGEKNFRKIVDKVLNSQYTTPVDVITKYILDVEDIAKALPQRNFDLVLHRKGSGFGKTVEVGSENKYDSLVSFATNEGTRTGTDSDNYVEYQCFLKKDDLAIPIEVLCPDALLEYNPECEIYTLPFSYEVEKYEKEYRRIYNNGYEALVTMGNVKNIPVTELLETRLQELKKYLEKLLEDRSYVDELLTKTQSDESTRIFIEAGYVENEDVEQISLLEVLNSFQESGKLRDVVDFDKKIQNDSNQYDSYTHGKNHTRRVGFFARVIGENVGLSERDMKVLLFAVQNHDIGRTHDWEDKEHGEKSVDKLKQLRKREELSADEMKLVYFMIENHSKSVRENEQAISMLPEEKQEKYRLMLACLKDADKLDRIRLGKYDGLDASRLQLPFCQKIVRMAYETNYVWNDIADRFDGKAFEVGNIIQSVDRAMELVADRKRNPVEMKIETRKEGYYDDPAIEEVVTESETNLENGPEVVLGEFVAKSEKQTSMSFINMLVLNVKNKVIKFLKGKQTLDKSEDVK